MKKTLAISHENTTLDKSRDGMVLFITDQSTFAAFVV